MVSQPIRLINLFWGRLPFFLFLRLSFIFLEVVFLVGSNKQKIFFLVVFHFFWGPLPFFLFFLFRSSSFFFEVVFLVRSKYFYFLLGRLRFFFEVAFHFFVLFLRSSSIFCWGCLTSWGKRRLHTKNQLPRLPGSALKVFGGVVVLVGNTVIM